MKSVYPRFIILVLAPFSGSRMKLGRAGAGLLPLSLTFPLLAVLLEDHQCFCGERNQNGPVRAPGETEWGRGKEPHITMDTGGQ